MRKEVVSLEYRVNKAFEGKYFMGHTPVLALSGTQSAWGGLINPEKSGVNLYINTFTVSNKSGTPFNAELWLNSSMYGKVMTSPFESASNVSFKPLPEPQVKIRYAQELSKPPINGKSLFSRIAEPNSTVVGNYYGKIVLPPGGTFIVFLNSPNAGLIKAELAFGWWEDKD